MKLRTPLRLLRLYLWLAVAMFLFGFLTTLGAYLINP